MEIDVVRNILKYVALTHPRDDDSKELIALRAISTALMHIAGAVSQIQHGLFDPNDAIRPKAPWSEQ
jgi:hypothetical protein